MRYIFWANHCTKLFYFCVHSGALDLIYPETSLYEHILWMHLEKSRTYAYTFPVQRKEINVVKVSFVIWYSSRKLIQVKSGNVLLLGKKSFEIPPFFQTRPGDLGKKVHACSLRFSALKSATILANWASNLTVLSSRSTWVEIRCSPLTFEERNSRFLNHHKHRSCLPILPSFLREECSPVPRVCFYLSQSPRLNEWVRTLNEYGLIELNECMSFELNKMRLNKLNRHQWSN